MNLSDAESYFYTVNLSDAESYFYTSRESWLDRWLSNPDELQRQIDRHAGCEPYIFDALRTLDAFVSVVREARRVSPKAARTLAGRDALRLLFEEGAPMSWGKLANEVSRMHKRAGVRSRRVLDQLEKDGAIVVEYEFGGYGQRPNVTVSLPAPAVIDEPEDDDDPRASMDDEPPFGSFCRAAADQRELMLQANDPATNFGAW